MSRKKRPKGLPKYAPDVLAGFDKLSQAGLAMPGVYTVEVKHDAWCNLLNGRGECNCNPEVSPPKRLGSEKN